MHHMDPRESSRLGDMRVNDVIKGIGGMKLSDVIKGIVGPILPGLKMRDAMKRIEAMPLNHVSIPITDLGDLGKTPADKRIRAAEYRLPRVPEWVRAVDPDVYTPKFICIGPYHRGENGNPLRQEQLKKDFVNRLWEYSGPNINKCLDELDGELAESSRRFYLETFDDINDEEWAMMLLLDGCFVIMHLLNFTEREYEFTTNWEKLQVKIDLALLENQLPFFILEKIFELFFPNLSHDNDFQFKSSTTILRGMAVFYWVSRRREDFEAMKIVKNTDKKVHNLVHLIHMAHCDLIDTEQVGEPKSGPLTKIKKIIRFCPIMLMMVLTLFKDNEMTEVVEVKKFEEVYERVEAVGKGLHAWKKAMSAVVDAANVAAKASEAAKENAAVAAVDEKAAMAKVATANAKKETNMAEDLADSAVNKAEQAKALAKVAKEKQKAVAMGKVQATKKEVAAEAKKAADALNGAHRDAAEAKAAKLKAVTAWKFVAESANKVHEAALKAADEAAKAEQKAMATNMAGVADEAAKAARKATKAIAAANKKEMRPKENIASAMHLHNLGIQFVKTKRTIGSRYDVRISSNDEDMLVIPPVEVSGTTAPLLHNLIAFEQQGKLIIDDHFTKYAFLMYNLIDSEEDISLLQSRGILLNHYGTNEQVISYFKNLLLWNSRLPVDYSPKMQTPWEKVQDFCRNLHPSNCLLRRQGKASPDPRPMAIMTALEALEARSKHRAYQDWAEAKTYCNSPVHALVLVTSIIVFASTIVQTVTSLSGR